VSLTWDADTERRMTSEPEGLAFALVYATGRQHVSVYRPKDGQWRLVLMAPIGVPDELLMELARVHLTAEEARAVERGLGAEQSSREREVWSP
jgi:hypothetical protein